MCSCGAISHKTADCLERPRKTGAKWTGKFIAADEKIEDFNLETYDARRDRWNGYDSNDYTKIMDRQATVIELHAAYNKKVSISAAGHLHFWQLLHAPAWSLKDVIGCRHEQVENVKQELKKEKALEKAYKVRPDGEAGSASSDEEEDDEDKLAEEDEAGQPPRPMLSAAVNHSMCI